ncbi:Tyrosine-protein phosphatase non-receptor type 4 [Bulinus truncatus]|nr:Tyrosine-protein phosphatase non-receptor type 4 [Bulinus truncatus]
MLIFMASPFSWRPGPSSQKVNGERLKSKNHPVKKCGQRVVVRQCRIGSSIAFSLVGVPQGSPEANCILTSITRLCLATTSDLQPPALVVLCDRPDLYLWTDCDKCDRPDFNLWTDCDKCDRPDLYLWTDCDKCDRPDFNLWTDCDKCDRPDFNLWTDCDKCDRPDLYLWTDCDKCDRPDFNLWTDCDKCDRPDLYLWTVISVTDLTSIYGLTVISVTDLTCICGLTVISVTDLTSFCGLTVISVTDLTSIYGLTVISVTDLTCICGLTTNGNGFTDGHGLVTIRMKPDEKGRFGFNVKGGADQGMPIIVSRVAPNTPADLAIPRLNEGDQVLLINGRDVSQHTHEQVVMFIKASRETHSGELALVIRPNVYVGEDQTDEPDLTYIPETHQIASSASSANSLESSLMLLQESLESGAAIAQFEQLYRKKPGLTLNAARLEVNINKNRYRDISPYDQTRVVLKSGTAGDYINANYVNMEIPGSGIVNRYIAAQGPLPNTCNDFWQMVWEQHSSLVVMLTTKVERGRVKCHQYWPQLYETEDFGALQITCVKEEETHSFAFREFSLTHVETSEERHIRHMQYIAWPDHGVPDDPSDFLNFVVRVRQNRDGMVEPTVVHCSAGIGRTGVLITMETAMCLIESAQPVNPLLIVRQMRDQRAMLIQTSSQYKFVCEAILRVYNEGLVKPQDFRR